MMTDSDNVMTARRYLAAIGQFAQGDALAAFFTPDVCYEELPNRLKPAGARSDLIGLLAAAARGAQILTSQRYEIEGAVAMGDRVALEVRWTGTLAVPIGTLAAGSEMTARSAMFLEFREGKIAAQRNYDCFDPF
jgi:ketosteroid isomerase-like protein